MQLRHCGFYVLADTGFVMHHEDDGRWHLWDVSGEIHYVIDGAGALLAYPPFPDDLDDNAVTPSPYTLADVTEFVPDALELLLKHSTVDPVTGCWLWQGYKSKGGYGKCYSPMHKRTLWTHQLAWALADRPALPEGYELDHTCTTPACCNPEHLEPVTGEENKRRARERRGLMEKCRRGHDVTDGSVNLYLKPGGKRRCMACARLHRTKYNHRVRKQSKRRVVA